ncbi:hypothetical protein D9V30_00230 [Mycetocola reblochoni]|uniref:HTH cro/C1-type domain-containing protein n=1 Tax=Mycetocola reblochoni TaxID=331618 RepID=A0A3L6ZSQ3_9MICO|nr:helix-turn-helix domain-containing protein [Mycetocola reblochoni]RLP70898.1 hypothetical protein D9V30_00230 [Mycetocola reblochoni]
MGNSERAAAQICRLLEEQDRSVAWLARTTGISYKRLLAEVKHQSTRLSLVTTMAACEALGLTLPEIISSETSAA